MRVLAFLFIFSSTVSFAQTTSSFSAEEKLRLYSLKNDTRSLFIHYDKNVYTNNETIWFTGYLMHAGDSMVDNTLNVCLVRNRDSSMIQERKYIIEKNKAFGNLQLKDSLEQGAYTLLAFTNVLRNGSPEAVFIQPITIKTNYEPSFSAQLKWTGPITASTVSATALLQVFTADMRAMPDKEVLYVIGNGKKIKTKTDKNGEVLFTVIPDQVRNNPTVSVQILANKEIKNLQLAVPQFNRTAAVKFYPEGGPLIHDINTTIGWEAKTNTGAPLAVQGILFRDDAVVDTIQTDGYGMGRFELKPDKNARYSFKLIGYNSSDTVYNLPDVHTEGVALHIKEAIVRDTLAVAVKSNSLQSLTVTVHNFKEVYYSSVQTIQPGRTRTLKMPVASEVPPGLAAVTISDAAGRPLAERIVFFRYRERPHVKISSDKEAYGPREKVTLQLQYDGQQHGDAQVSIACVQNDRLLPDKTTDIESFVYLDNALADLPFTTNKLRSADDDNYLESVLLIKGWRRYRWNDLLSVSPADTLHSRHELVFTGKITKYGKPVKKPVGLSVFSKTALQFFQTDEKGSFVVDNRYLQTAPDKKIYFIVTDKNKDAYALKVNDPYADAENKLLKSIDWLLPDAHPSTTDAYVVKKDERIKMLETVVVRSSKNDHVFGGRPGTNACGDYVCTFGILNCLNHSYGTQPVIGVQYYTRTGTMMTKETYQGCFPDEEKEYLLMTTGIYARKEFYSPDEAAIRSAEPMNRSTLYWNYEMALGTSPATISFYTGDFTGRFRVVVQGVTKDNHPVSAVGMFTVKSK